MRRHSLSYVKSSYVMYCVCVVFFFFFQAEDGIRDLTVTGVQTCALPIYDQQPLLVDVPELLAEKPRVLTRLAPQRRHRAEVVRARDQCDADRVSLPVGGRDERDESAPLLGRRLDVEREEDLLAQQEVAGGVAVCVVGRG